MELQGKIRQVLETRSGVSKSTGNPWMSQEIVIDYFWWSNQRDASQIVMTIFGEDRINNWKLQPNDEVNVRYHVEAHQYNGRWFNEIRVDGITFVGISVAKNNPLPPIEEPQPSQPDSMAAQHDNDPAAVNVPTAEPAEKPDDLPF